MSTSKTPETPNNPPAPLTEGQLIQFRPTAELTPLVSERERQDIRQLPYDNICRVQSSSTGTLYVLTWDGAPIILTPKLTTIGILRLNVPEEEAFDATAIPAPDYPTYRYILEILYRLNNMQLEPGKLRQSLFIYLNNPNRTKIEDPAPLFDLSLLTNPTSLMSMFWRNKKIDELTEKTELLSLITSILPNVTSAANLPPRQRTETRAPHQTATGQVFLEVTATSEGHYCNVHRFTNEELMGELTIDRDDLTEDFDLIEMLEDNGIYWEQSDDDESHFDYYEEELTDRSDTTVNSIDNAVYIDDNGNHHDLEGHDLATILDNLAELREELGEI